MQADSKVQGKTIDRQNPSSKNVKVSLWRVGRGREPWERSEAGGVIGNERHLHRSPVSSPTEELRKS